jgi:hypothetical protein
MRIRNAKRSVEAAASYLIHRASEYLLLPVLPMLYLADLCRLADQPVTAF